MYNIFNVFRRTCFLKIYILLVGTQLPSHVSDFQDTSETIAKKGKKGGQKDTSDSAMSQFFEFCTGVLRNATQKRNVDDVEDDSMMVTARHFASKLRKMGSDQQIYAELLIQRILTLGQLNKLTESTDINITEGNSDMELITLADGTVLFDNGTKK